MSSSSSPPPRDKTESTESNSKRSSLRSKAFKFWAERDKLIVGKSRRRQRKEEPTPGDGRDRKCQSVPPPDLTEAQARSYIEADKTSLKVFRCPTCEVRIANECDAVRRAKFGKQPLSVTFKRVFNLVKVGEQVACYRCGTDLFPYDAMDPFMLTIPLYHNDKPTLVKNAYRVHLYVWLGVVRCQPFWDNDGTVELESPTVQGLNFLDGIFSRCCPNRDIKVTHTVETDIRVTTPRKPGKISGLIDNRERLKEAEKLHAEAGAPSFTWIDKEDLPGRLTGTCDAAVLIRFNYNNYPSAMTWSDYNGDAAEERLLPLWLMSGGNVLFGNWGLPRGARAGEIAAPVIDGVVNNMDTVADFYANMEDEHWQGNKMPSMQQLFRDGHYLGIWDQGVLPPDAMVQRFVRLMEGTELYPQWRFLFDYPKYTFEFPLRRYGRRPFAFSLNDPVSPPWRTEFVKLKKEEHEAAYQDILQQKETGRINCA